MVWTPERSENDMGQMSETYVRYMEVGVKVIHDHEPHYAQDE